jgi:hypothetical protein
VDDCEVAAMTPDQYTAFEQSSPALARELLFALGRILSIRLRSTTAKVVRVAFARSRTSVTVTKAIRAQSPLDVGASTCRSARMMSGHGGERILAGRGPH